MAVSQACWRDTYTNDAARLNHIQLETASLRADRVIAGAGVQPQFVATFGGELRQKLESEAWTEVDGNNRERLRDIGDAFERLQTFDRNLARVHGIDFVALGQVSANGFIAPAGAVFVRADDGNGFHFCVVIDGNAGPQACEMNSGLEKSFEKCGIRRF